MKYVVWEPEDEANWDVCEISAKSPYLCIFWREWNDPSKKSENPLHMLAGLETAFIPSKATKNPTIVAFFDGKLCQNRYQSLVKLSVYPFQCSNSGGSHCTDWDMYGMIIHPSFLPYRWTVRRQPLLTCYSRDPWQFSGKPTHENS